jgi:hypothetical protein
MSKRSSLCPTAIQFDNRSLLLFAVITLGSSGVAFAQSAAAPMTNDKPLVALFAQADKDGDKALNQEEAKAIPALAERFAEVDTNGDGLVSQAEFMASMQPAKS